MKGILEFDLNDPSDVVNHKRAVLATEMALILFEVTHNLKRKITEDKSDEYVRGVDHVLDKIYGLMEEQGINLDNILE